MLPTLAFVLVTGFTLNNGAISTIVVPGLADENECHKLALKLNTPSMGALSTGWRCRTLTCPMLFKTRSKMELSGEAYRFANREVVNHRRGHTSRNLSIMFTLGITA
jgi:hypothetical protein